MGVVAPALVRISLGFRLSVQHVRVIRVFQGPHQDTAAAGVGLCSIQLLHPHAHVRHGLQSLLLAQLRNAGWCAVCAAGTRTTPSRPSASPRRGR